jgi:hypothetical protein
MNILDIDNLVLNQILSIVRYNNTDKVPTREWKGTMTSLRKRILSKTNKLDKDLVPTTPQQLRLVMNRIANRIRTRGISVKFGRTNSERFVKLS